MQFLRSAADLQGAFQHRVTVLDSGYREIAAAAAYGVHRGARPEDGGDSEENVGGPGADPAGVRAADLLGAADHPAARGGERRRRRRAARAEGAAQLGGRLGFDYGRFAERFRGTEEYVKSTQEFYRPYFAGKANVLDLGCGRGEFLEMLRDLGVPGRGIDLSDESVAICRHKGLDAEKADMFEYLENLPEASLDGIFCSQVVEHIPPERLPGMIKLAASRLQRNGVIAIETPNPECLAIFATHFYLDPTHQRPVPHPLLAFYLEEFGVGNIEVRRLSPAVESMPSRAVATRGFPGGVFRRAGLRDYGEEVVEPVVTLHRRPGRSEDRSRNAARTGMADGAGWRSRPSP